MSEYSDLTGQRDWSTPLPWAGTPYVKTYFDWTHYVWRTEVCILLGTRQEAPGRPWGDRRENAGKGRKPDRERKDLSPQGHRAAVNATKAMGGQAPAVERAASLRSLLRAYLAEHGESSTSEIHQVAPETSIGRLRSALWNDPSVECLGGGKKGKESRWRLKEATHAK